MVRSTRWVLGFAGAVAALLASASPLEGGLFDCLSTPAPAPNAPQVVVTARSTYGPRFNGRAAYVSAPAASYASPADVAPTYAPYATPGCSSCTAPSCAPVVVPSCGPCAAPTCNPCVIPSCGPCVIPSCGPCVIPSCGPCVVPSCGPCMAPSCGSCVAPSCGSCVAPSCTTCNRPVVRYVPQQYVPQTSYRPIFASAPTATYVRRPALVPYTTYLIGPRPVCSSCPSAAYAGCSTGACGGYAPSAAYVPAAPGGCSSCAVGSAPAAMTVAPTTVAPMPAPATSQPTPSPEVAPLEGPPQTFRTPEPARTESHKVPAESDGPALEPTPMAPEQAPVQGSSYRPGPQIAPFGTPPGFRLDDRTTFRPVTPTRFRTASLTQTVPATPAASSPAVIDNGGWRPATD